MKNLYDWWSLKLVFFQGHEIFAVFRRKLHFPISASKTCCLFPKRVEVVTLKDNFSFALIQSILTCPQRTLPFQLWSLVLSRAFGGFMAGAWVHTISGSLNLFVGLKDRLETARVSLLLLRVLVLSQIVVCQAEMRRLLDFLRPHL